MAEGKKSFIAYVDWKETFDALSDDKAGKLIKHLFAYVNDENPTSDEELINFIFINIKQQLKRDLQKYERIKLKNRENGIKGGRPKNPTKPKKPSGLINNPNKPSKTQPNPTEPKKPDTDTVNDNDTDTDIVNDKIKKDKYADFVCMLPCEYEKLVEQHTEKNTKILVEILNNYKGATGKKYKSDYLAILNWVVDRAKKDGKYIQKPVMV